MAGSLAFKSFHSLSFFSRFSGSSDMMRKMELIIIIIDR